MSAITDMIDKAPLAADRLDLDLAKLPRNDYGNAMRLLRREGDNLLFVDEIGAHVWDGRRWSAEGGEYRAMQLFLDARSEDADHAFVPAGVEQGDAGRGIVDVHGLKQGQGLRDVTVQIVGIPVRTGDWLYADEDGVVVSRKNLFG